MKPFHTCLWLLLSWPSFCYGQTFITIKGRILDKEDRQPIPYAHVGIKGKPVGTVSNINGEFDFHIAGGYLQDTLIISTVGYEPFFASIAKLSQDNQQTFYLEKAIRLLDEVKITDQRITAREVFQTAISKIPDNYPSDPYIMNGFFRDWKAVDHHSANEDSYLLLEAAVNIYDPGYLMKGRKKFETTFIKEIRRTDLPDKPKHGTGWNYYNSLFRSILSGNYVKYPKAVDPSVTEPLLDFPNNYSFTFDKSATTADLIVINGRGPDHPLTYKIYINAEDHAFVRIDLIDEDTSVPGTDGHKLDLINNTQRFKKWNGKWYLAYKRLNWEVSKINLQTGKTILEEDYFMELLVNDVEPVKAGKLPEGLGMPMDRKKPLEFQVRPYNTDFWENYNVIKDHPSGEFTPAGKGYKNDLAGSFKKSGLKRSNQEYALPRQVDEYFQWNFNKEDSLLGNLNPMRKCYDVTSYELHVDIDPVSETIKGSCAVNFIVLNATKRMQVDLHKQLSINAVQHNAEKLKYTREYNSVFIDLPYEFSPGSVQQIKIDYDGKPLEPVFSIPQYGAFVWSKDDTGKPWIQSVCQGSGPNGWWPNKDHISDKADSVLIKVTIPTALRNVSNGQLVEQKDLPEGKSTYQWKVTYPVINYNISVNVGNYRRFSDLYAGIDTLMLEYFVLDTDQSRAREAFAIVKPMLKTYETLFGPYPFPHDGFKLVQSPLAMEHQSCIAIGPDFSQDIILHESAHEWWGNSVSCVDLAELWIHESFATYAVALFKEINHGEKEATAYFEFLRDQVKNERPIIGTGGVKHIHYDIIDMYVKGALMLHTLRNVISDDSLWFDILKGIQHDFRYKSINTAQIVDYINRKTKTDYSYFFNQYLRYPSPPELQISVRNEGEKSTLKHRWVAGEPDFRMPVKIKIGGKKPEFIYPTNKWQSLILKDYRSEEVTVDREFYIRLKRL